MLTDEQIDVLARYRSWGGSGVADMFDTREGKAERHGIASTQLRGFVGADGYDAARRTIINAHYTAPAYVEAMWTFAAQAGFTTGRVLEPGCGIGGFLPYAPTGCDLVGVELDPTSAHIGQLLHPGATIRNESFVDTRYPPGYFDLVIGNVPFANLKPTDPRYNPHREHSLHNYMLIKAADLTAPGGLVIALTSRWTLDARNPASRAALADLTDFVGAVRLPSSAHARFAGTEAITDLVVLKRRGPGVEPSPLTRQVLLAQPASRLLHDPRTGRQTHVDVSAYFSRGEHVLGTAQLGNGLNARDDLHVEPISGHAVDAATIEADTATLLRHELAQFASPEARWAPHHNETRHNETRRDQAREQVRVASAPAPGAEEGHLLVTEPQAGKSGGFATVRDGLTVPLDVPKAQQRELTALLGLRDATVSLLRAEAASMDDSDEIARMRRQLNLRYDAYHGSWGPLNRFKTIITSRIDKETGEAVVQRRVPPVMRTFKQDPYAPVVFALEDFDESSQRAHKAPIMSQRVVLPRIPRRGADNADDAVAICLDMRGHVDLDVVAELLGVDRDQALSDCSGIVYPDPSTGQWVPRAEFLSGNVRAKLDASREALARLAPDSTTGDRTDDSAAERAAYTRAVTDLQRVVPADLGPGEISVRLGAAWVPAADVESFLTETLRERVEVIHAGGSEWKVQGGKHSVESTSTYGTVHRSAGDLAEKLLTATPILVHTELDDGRRILNQTETLAAQEKAEALNEAFERWLWTDPERTDRLCRAYNRQFNSLVLRSYDGEHLSLPGLARNFTPREHQRAAVARMIAEPAVGLFHEVGAGKTAEMVMGVMELRRLGMVRKPAIVVPNHMLDQFSREFLQLYPQARILAASTDDLAGEKRRRFVARAATTDWDAIILTRGSFQRLDVSTDTIRAYLSSEMELLRAQLGAYKASGQSAKRLENAVARREEVLKAKMAQPRDPGMTFEETGIDYLCVDEAHDYKNLATVSSIPGAAIQGSQRATDLHMKLFALRARHGDRVVTAATATPIANSMTEAYVMQRYLRPDLLEAAGLPDFDSWANTFGRVTASLEFTATGELKMKHRFAQFVNVPELLRMWHVAGDVKTAEDLQLPTPALRPQADGSREPAVIVIPSQPWQEAYMARLRDRAESVSGFRPEQGEDNILVVNTDGRKAALDQRLLSGTERAWIQTAAPDAGIGATKTDVVAEQIMRIWRESANTYYQTSEGNPSPVPGALQIVFCDLGTPNTGSKHAGGRNTSGEGRFSVYDQLRDTLTESGMPRDRIRYIHEADTDAAKARLFAACRAGHVSVLIGSTAKMGVGTNIQDRAIALHHVDCPWRPADLAQRDGRIMRQGNQNAEVEILRYVTERSFDAAIWGAIARKATFIGQVLRGRLDVREIDDVGDVALDAAQVAAAVSGDNRLLVKAQLEADVNRLERLERAHTANQGLLRTRVHQAELRLPVLDRLCATADRLAGQAADTKGDAFVATIAGRTIHTRTDAAKALAPVLSDWIAKGYPDDGRTLITVGNVPFTGRHVDLASDSRLPQLRPLGLHQPETLVRDPRNPVGAITSMEHTVADLATTRDRLHTTREQVTTEHTQAAAQVGQTFPRAKELASRRGELAALTAELAAQIDNNPHTDQAGASEPGEPGKPGEQAEAAADATHRTNTDRTNTDDTDIAGGDIAGGDIAALRQAAFPTGPASAEPASSLPAAAWRGPDPGRHDRGR